MGLNKNPRKRIGMFHSEPSIGSSIYGNTPIEMENKGTYYPYIPYERYIIYIIPI